MICIGHTDLPSRLPTQSSTLYSNNISKFLLSMGPFTNKDKKDHFQVGPGMTAAAFQICCIVPASSHSCSMMSC